jgi:hypothetical protein
MLVGMERVYDAYSVVALVVVYDGIHNLLSTLYR